MSLSKLDLIYRRLILTKFYTRGWGKPEELSELLKVHDTIADRTACADYVKGLAHQKVTLNPPIQRSGCVTVDGCLESPVCQMLPELIPDECRTAHFQLVLPSRLLKIEKSENTPPLRELVDHYELKPVCIHMAGTGDHGFARRRELLAKPLLSCGISSLLLENPYYGVRKPKEQTRSGLLQVKDLFIMGVCLVLEAQVLLSWLEKEGYGPFGLTGISMGGHMASLAATNWTKPLAIIPCMSWTSSSVVWTEGVLSKSIPWRVLETQYATDPQYESQINNLIKLNTVDSYELGKDYAKDECAIKLGTSTNSTDETTAELKNRPERKKTVKEKRQRQTILFMKGVMDQLTDIRNFSVPVDPTLATFVIAKADAYYPIHKLQPMDEVWPGCEVRLLNTGHIAGFLMHHTDFCAAITDTFERLIQKYHAPQEHADEVTPVNSDNERRLIKTTNTIHGPSFLQTLRVFTIKS